MPLHKILPQLEDATRLRIASPLLEQMDEGDLRPLVYQIVDSYRKQLSDPDALFDAMIDAANEVVDLFKEASSAAASARAQVLTRILQLSARSLHALSGPVCIRIMRRAGNQKFHHHPLLRGIQMGISRRGDGDHVSKARTIAHFSWWIIALGGDTDCPDARWACLTHRGDVDAHGTGEEEIEINLVTPLELAERTTGSHGAEMLAAFAKHLRTISATDSKLTLMIQEDRDLVRRIEAALVVIGAV